MTSFLNCLGRICASNTTINKHSTPKSTMCLMFLNLFRGKFEKDCLIIFMKIRTHLSNCIWGIPSVILFFYPTRILKFTILPCRINTNVSFLLFFDNPVVQKFLFFLPFIECFQHLIIISKIRFVVLNF